MKAATYLPRESVSGVSKKELVAEGRFTSSASILRNFGVMPVPVRRGPQTRKGPIGGMKARLQEAGGAEAPECDLTPKSDKKTLGKRYFSTSCDMHAGG